jgi:hypothetical protein
MEPIKAHERITYQFDRKEISKPYKAADGNPVYNFINKMKKKSYKLVDEFFDTKCMNLVFEKGEEPYNSRKYE